MVALGDFPQTQPWRSFACEKSVFEQLEELISVTIREDLLTSVIVFRNP
jgi:hypothetical protein